MKINILKILFHNELRPHQVSHFRGAIINALNQKNILFHNHLDDDHFRYRYPLIQYKIINGRAAIVCMGEGTEAIGEFFASAHFDVNIGNRSETLQLSRVEPRQFNIQVWEQKFHYRLRRWLPLNGENFPKYKQLTSLAEQCLMLEGILRGNILSMGKGLGITFDRQVECRITRLHDPYLVTVKGVKMQAFDIDFCANVSLPPHIGLGKHASINSGIVTPMRDTIPDDNNNQPQ